MKSLPWLLVIVLALSVAGAGCSADAPRVFRVRAPGVAAEGPGDAGDAIREALRAAVASGAPAEVVIEAGVYRVRAENPRGAAFTIRQATNLVVRGEGQGTRILVTDPAASGFVFNQCRSVALRDLVLDYNPVPFCQGRIRAVDVGAGSFDLEVEAGYPTPDAANFIGALEPYGKWGMILDPAVRRIRSGTPDHYMTPRWEHREGRVWRFFTAEEHYRRNLQSMRVGDAYVHLARGHGSAVLAQFCDGILIEGVTIHASPGLAVGLVGNRGEIRVRKLDVRFAPGTTRLLTANADGVHAQQNRSGPIVEDSYFEGMADDAINLYAPPGVVREIRSPTEWWVSSGAVILAGDRLQVLDPRAGRLRGEVKVVDSTPARGGFALRLDRALEGVVAGPDHREADTVYNLDACGAGFCIRRNRMNGNRRYGCLLRAGGGVVEDNLFEDTTGAGVVLTNEPDWPEGPVPWDIVIRRNLFRRGGTCLGYADSPHGAALVVRATRLGHGLAETEAIRGVVVEDNGFRDYPGTAVFVGGARGVTVRGNRVVVDPGTERLRKGPGMLIERSSGVVLLDNSVVDGRPATTAAVEIGPAVAPGEGGVRVSGLEATLAPGVPAIADGRGAR